jgi:hypothetical protein
MDAITGFTMPLGVKIPEAGAGGRRVRKRKRGRRGEGGEDKSRPDASQCGETEAVF